MGAVGRAPGGQHEAQPALAGADQPAGRDEHADAAGVAEEHLGQIQDETVMPLGHHVVHALTQHR